MAKPKKEVENVEAAHLGLEDLFVKGARHHATLRSRIEELADANDELHGKVMELERALDVKERAWKERFDKEVTAKDTRITSLEDALKRVKGELDRPLKSQ